MKTTDSIEARTGLTAGQAFQLRDALLHLAAAELDTTGLGDAVTALATAVADRLDAQERALGGPLGRLAGEIREMGGGEAAAHVAAFLTGALPRRRGLLEEIGVGKVS